MTNPLELRMTRVTNDPSALGRIDSALELGFTSEVMTDEPSNKMRNDPAPTKCEANARPRT
ncbi:MAG: hypothetical protein C3F11_14475 [Methylocystaceae bacterium]|nr:MAG: hypothetical protein C3F11_14475 [Methylocystaceae bacterium]